MSGFGHVPRRPHLTDRHWLLIGAIVFLLEIVAVVAAFAALS